jgi:spore coat polysaccharide biosynthesis protein SpsF
MQLQTLQQILPLSQIYIASTKNPSDDIIEEKYKNICNVYRGDEEDVLSRFLEISKVSNATNIIRIASDNPFIFKEGIAFLVQEHLKKSSDYTTFSIEEQPSMLVPCGLYVEIITAHALLEIEKNANKLEKEHVTYAIYTRLKEDYKVDLIKIEKVHPLLNNKSLRYTIDTLEDFNFIDGIIKELNIKQSPITLDQIINIIEYSKKTNALEIMEHESNKDKNSKNYQQRD